MTSTAPDHLQTIADKLDCFYQSEKIPHIIFHGSSGTGKQTIINAFLSKIYGGDKTKIKNNVMTVNCAHGKGIKFIRDDLKFFAKTNIQFSCGVLFKSIVLYNADYLTIDAQSALRRCIEIFSSNTRFFIVVENKNKLLKPILSRFCEIYVPDTLNQTTGRIENLHTTRIQEAYNLEAYRNARKDVLQGILMGGPDKNGSCHGESIHPLPRPSAEWSYPTLLKLSNRLYDLGYSAEDLIQWKKERDRSLLPDKTHGSTGSAGTNNPVGQSREATPMELVLVYNKIKSEFRCEKLVMFFLLDFMFMRLDKSLNNISFM
jgi:hypothetical protein